MRLTQEIKNKTRDIVTELGGPTKVVAIIRQNTGKDLKIQSVCNWYREGIPLKYLKMLCNKSYSYKVSEFRPDLF